MLNKWLWWRKPQKLNQQAINFKVLKNTTLLQALIEKNEIYAIQIILKRCIHLIDINERNQKGKTALHIAAEQEKIEIIQLLLDNPRLDINASDENGNTALHDARGQAIIKLLLNIPHATLRSNHFGSTPLHAGCYQEDIEKIKVLLSHEKVKRLINASDNEKNTPLHIAVRQGNPRLVQLLLESGAEESLFKENKYGKTPLSLCNNNDFSQVTHVKDIKAIKQLFDNYNPFKIEKRKLR